MFTHLAEAEVVNTDPSGTQPPSASLGNVVIDDDRQNSPARGIILAVLISTPFWLVVGVMVYLLV